MVLGYNQSEQFLPSQSSYCSRKDKKLYKKFHNCLESIKLEILK